MCACDTIWNEVQKQLKYNLIVCVRQYVWFELYCTHLVIECNEIHTNAYITSTRIYIKSIARTQCVCVCIDV